MAFSLRQSEVLPVRAAATGNITLASGLVNGIVIDGVTLATGDLVLCYSQNTATENGIWRVVASGAAVRATVMAAGTSATGVRVYVNEGTAHAGRSFIQTAKPAVVGTNALTFERVFAAGGLTAPSYSRTVINSSYTLTADSTWTSVPGLSITVPAGTWKVGYDISAGVQNNTTTPRTVMVQLHDGTAAVADTNRQIIANTFSGSTPFDVGAVNSFTYVTLAAPKTFTVQVHESGGNTGLHAVVFSSSAVFYEPVAQDLTDPNLIAPVDLDKVSAYRTTNQTTLTVGSPIIFTNVESGTASLCNTTTGTFTLPAGRWRLMASIERCDGSAGVELAYAWHNTTSGAVQVGSSGTVGANGANTVGFSGVAEADVTVTGTSTFQVRVTKNNAATSITSNSGSGIFAIVQQLPTSTMVRADSMTPEGLSYLMAERTTAQTTGLTAGSPVVFPTITTTIGSDISLNTSTGRVTLQPGTYRLTANAGSWVPSANARPAFQWYSFTDSAYLGPVTSAYSGADGSVHTQSGGSAEIVVNITAQKEYEFRLRTIGNGTLTQIGGSTDPGTAVYPSLVVQQLPTSTAVLPDALTPQPLNVAAGYRSGSQTGVTAGTDITWTTQTVVQGSITTSASTSWTLPAGTYDLSGTAYAGNFSDPTSGFGSLGFVNASGNTLIGSLAVLMPIGRNIASSPSVIFGGIVTFTTATTIKVRCVSSSGTFDVGSGAGNSTALVTIREVPMASVAYVDGGVDVQSHFSITATEEQTGELFLGQPVYRKYFDLSTVASGATLIAAGIVSRIISVTGQASDGSAYYSVPYADGTTFMRVWQSVTTGAVTLNRAGNFTSARSGEWCVLTYTKV